MAEMRIALYATDFVDTMTFVRKATADWPEDRRNALYDDMEDVIRNERAVEVDFARGTAFAVVSASFLDVLTKHGLTGLDIGGVQS